MPATRKTRSGRPAPAPPSKRVRTKGGCLTCRIRRKKCDESRDHNGGCETCARLHIECLGYSNKRPEWLKGPQVENIKRQIKHFLADHSAKSSSRSSDGAFLELQTSRARPSLPRQHPDSEHSDSDSEPDLKSAASPTYDYSSSPIDFYNPGLPWTDDWSQPDSLPPQLWDPSFPIYSNSYGPAGNIDDGGMPGLVDPLPMDTDESIMLMIASYEAYNPQDHLPYDLFFSLLRIDHTSGPLRHALVQGFQNDPEGVLAVIDASREGDLAERGQAAMRALANAGCDKAEYRALTCLCMMTSSLSRGDPSLWGDCLDLLLGWTKGVCSNPPLSIFDGSVTQLVLKRTIWSDIIAGATTKRHPLHIDIYRKLLASSEDVLDDCPNRTALAMAETVALAAHPDLIPQASRNLDQLREELDYPRDPTLGDSSSKAEIHTAGVRLYLEITAHHGVVDHPGIQEAVANVCTSASRADDGQLRDFAFWIFLAGCHTSVPDRFSNCCTMMQGISDDATVQAATVIMRNVYHAHKQADAQPGMWSAQMNEHRLLLI